MIMSASDRHIGAGQYDAAIIVRRDVHDMASLSTRRRLCGASADAKHAAEFLASNQLERQHKAKNKRRPL